jgi:hypothetical protein
MRRDPPRDLEPRIRRPGLEEERVLRGGRRHAPGSRYGVVTARLRDDRGRRDPVIGREDRRDCRGLEDRPPPVSILGYDADQTAFVDQ